MRRNCKQYKVDLQKAKDLIDLTYPHATMNHLSGMAILMLGAGLGHIKVKDICDFTEERIAREAFVEVNRMEGK